MKHKHTIEIHPILQFSNNLNAILDSGRSLPMKVGGKQFEVPCYDRITVGRNLRENNIFIDLFSFDGATQGIARRYIEISPVTV